MKSCSNGKFTMKLSASIPNLKSQAKRKAKEGGIPPAEALNHIAMREGFETWSLLARKFEEQDNRRATAHWIAPQRSCFDGQERLRERAGKNGSSKSADGKE
mgnify:CR=1 FL=1